MYKYSLLFLCFISVYSSQAFIPMEKNKHFKEDVCAYPDSSIMYVKPCKEGKYCEMMNQLGICQDVPFKAEIKSLGDDCSSDFECEYNLECINTKCTYPSCTSAGYSIVKTDSGAWTCQSNTDSGLCYYYDFTNARAHTISHDYFQVCGKITFKITSPNNVAGKQYQIEKIETAYIGTIENDFVSDERACKSGYALYFYPDGTLIDPGKDDYTNNMYKKCVTINNIEKRENTCIIQYDTNKIYNVDQLATRTDKDGANIVSSSLSNGKYYLYLSNDRYICSDFLLTKLEMFSKYINLFTVEKQKQCATKENYNEPETCNDNEIRKWYYFYNKPDDYILYYDEENKNNDVVNFLLQSAYKSHISSTKLNIKYFISFLIILLSL